MKTTGYDLKRFYADTRYWPYTGGDSDPYHDELVLMVNNEEWDDPEVHALQDSDNVKIVYGHVTNPERSLAVTFSAYFRRWLKEQRTRRVVIEVPADKLSELKKVVRSAGGKVL